jgi:hypothetical protein
MKRYVFAPRHRALLYPYRLDGESTALVPETELREACPLTWGHLFEHRRHLELREGGKLAGVSWYALSFASDLRMFQGPKLATPTLAPLNSFASDDSGCAFPQGAGGGCGIVPNDPLTLRPLLAILNSRLLTYYFQRISTCFQGGWFAYEPRFLNRIPVCMPDAASTEGRDLSEQLGQGAAQLTHICSDMTVARTPAIADGLRRERTMWERRVDRLVYHLYGLTQNDITVIEASFEKE